MSYCKCEWHLARKNSFDLLGDVFTIGGYRILYKSFIANDYRLKVSGNRNAIELFNNGYADLKNIYKLYPRMVLMDIYVVCPRCSRIIFNPAEIKTISLLTSFSNNAYYDLLTYLENMVISREINYRYI